jgi:hypothetical protein
MIIESYKQGFPAIIIKSGSLSSKHGPHVELFEPQYVPLYSANKYKQVLQVLLRFLIFTLGGSTRHIHIRLLTQNLGAVYKFQLQQTHYNRLAELAAKASD